MHKTTGYVRTVVAIHNLRDKAKEAVDALQDKSLPERVKDKWNESRREISTRTRNFFTHPENVQCEHIPPIYSYIFRPKSRWELVLLSGTVCGIEFCYAAETAFVTPILLSLGMGIRFVTMIWCLSPLIGFFLTPILGSLSDSCESSFGRRRPFILLLSAGILLGLLLVPNGHHIGIALGDKPQVNVKDLALASELQSSNMTFKNMTNTYDKEIKLLTADNQIAYEANTKSYTMHNTNARSRLTSLLDTFPYILNETQSPVYRHRNKRLVGKGNVKSTIKGPSNITRIHVQPWSIAFTVIGTVLLDFCSDACQSPSRTYLLDVTIHEDHNAGLSTFTLMAGLGGSCGYLMGAVHWESTFWGHLLGGQVNAVFMIVLIVFIMCLIATLSSFPEIPLTLLKDPKTCQEYQQKLQIGEYQEKGSELEVIDSRGQNYGTTSVNDVNNVNEVNDDETSQVKDTTPNGILNEVPETNPVVNTEEGETVLRVPVFPPEPVMTVIDDDQPTLKEYLRSIIHMPKSLRILCLTNLFCWMSLVCYSLYFTDFVGEVVYGGDPQAPEGSYRHELYKDGVRFGCWGMALYSLSCSIYSYFIEALVARLGAKPVYIGGQLVYSVGMIIMAAARHPVAVILLSPTAGVMYSTLFTMPYLLIAHYHCMQTFRDDTTGGECGIRGIGTDVASVSSMVFLSQFILSLTMGTIVEAVGSNLATVCAAAFLSACGAASASQVMYLDM